MRKGKSILRAALFTGAAMAGLWACQKADTGTTADLSENTLKAAAQTFTSETFDEVMEIGDETLGIYERLTHGKDTVKGNDNGQGHHGLGSRAGHDLLESLWRHHRDSLSVDELGHLRDSLGPNFGHYRLSKCTKISREWAGDTLVTTINFGSDSCAGPDGKVRTGKIIMTSIGDYWKGDAFITLSCEDYFVNGNQVTGTTTVSTTINADGNHVAQIKEEGTVTMADGSGTITWNSEKTRVVKKGTDTLDRKDDVIEVTGTASGTLLSGNTFTSATQTPLVRTRQKDCAGVFISGITNISISDGTEIVVDYGDGTCDNLATVTTDGVSETITIGKFRPFRPWKGLGRRH
jgi:hypothetical protein